MLRRRGSIAVLHRLLWVCITILIRWVAWGGGCAIRSTSIGTRRGNLGFTTGSMGRGEGQVRSWAEPYALVSSCHCENGKDDDDDYIGFDDEPSQPRECL